MTSREQPSGAVLGTMDELLPSYVFGLPLHPLVVHGAAVQEHVQLVTRRSDGCSRCLSSRSRRTSSAGETTAVAVWQPVQVGHSGATAVWGHVKDL